MNIPNGLQLCGPALSPLIQRHTLLLAGTFDHWTPDMTDDDVWAICDVLMEREGYETLAHFMPTNCATAIKERVAREAGSDPKAKREWQARLDLARSAAVSSIEVSARMMAASLRCPSATISTTSIASRSGCVARVSSVPSKTGNYGATAASAGRCLPVSCRE